MDHRLKCKAYNYISFRRKCKRKYSGYNAKHGVLRFDIKFTVHKRKENQQIVPHQNKIFLF